MSTVEVHTKAAGKTTIHNLESRPGGFTVLVHPQGIKVDVPSFVEVSCRTTIPCMEAVTQGEWEWMSQGDLFKMCWAEAFDFSHGGGKGEELIGRTPPATIDELLDSDPGVIHVAGMIVQGCEAMFAGKNVFFRNPETLLHPATERYIVGMFHKMLELCGGRGTVTKTEADPDKVEEAPKPKRGRRKKEPDKQEPEDPEAKTKKDKEHCLEWLSKFPKDKAVVGDGNLKYTAAQLTMEIQQDSLIGKRVIELFVQRRDET